jgi:hypothetical protein
MTGLPRSRALLAFSLALALLVWLPLGLAGVPLDTPDGFLHLGWAVGWARQVAGGWWWPQWTDLNWAGAGSFALAIYPPLFRLLVGVPLLAGLPPDHALALALLAVLLVNALGAFTLARVWLPAGPWRWALLLGACLNPYLLVNLYVRGAWPEALAQGLLWWFIAGLVGLRRRRWWGVAAAAGALAGVVLSNWNAALLTLMLWGLTALALAAGRAWQPLRRWTLAVGLALGATAPFWWPALRLLPQLRPPIPAGLFLGEFFLAGAAGAGSFARLLWIQALVLALLLAARGVGWGWRSDWLGWWGLGIGLLSLGLMLPLSQPLYGALPPLQRIQFPWRWLGPAWLGTLLWLSSAGLPGRATARRPGLGRRIGAGVLLAGALGGWFDSLWRFRTNLVGHAPSGEERLALRQLLACDPLAPCPQGMLALGVGGELAKRFAALGDGRIALAGVPDYSPAPVPERSWQRRLQTFWLPAWPQPSWAEFSGPGRALQVSRGPTQRTLLVEAEGSGTLRLMQWAHPVWRVQVRPAGAGDWSAPRAAGSADPDGWISVRLPRGRWEVALTYGAARSAAGSAAGP